MSSKAELVISNTTEFYLEAIVAKLIYQLKRVRQSIRLNPDNGLDNLWEDICVQKQKTPIDGFRLLEDYLESQISLIVDKLPIHVQMILSYDEFEDGDINLDLIIEKVTTHLYFKADAFSNDRIQFFLITDI